MDRRTFVVDASLYAATLTGAPSVLAASRERAPPVIGLLVGADPAVEALSAGGAGIDVSGFPIPRSTGPTTTPFAHGAAGDGATDDRSAVISAWNSLPSTGGVLDVSGGLFGVGSNTQNQLTAKSGITIRGGGAGTGFRALSQSFAGGNRAILEFEGVTNLVLRDFEVDLNDQPIGGIRPGRDTNTWIVSCWVHDAGTSNGHISGDKPSAMIRGFNGHIDLHVIGCLIENSRGDAGSNSGTRGIWMSTSGLTGARIEHCIVRNMGHTGIALHVDESGNQTQVRRCTLTDNAGAGAKPEKPDARSADWDPGSMVQIYELNYCANNGFAGFQVESMGVRLYRNLVVGRASAVPQGRGVTTFDDFRRIEIDENIFRHIGQYGLYIDAPTPESFPDKTNLFFRNNTFDGESGADGIHFFDDFSGAGIFSGNNPIVVTGNRTTNFTNLPVKTTIELDNYENFINADNGPSAPGAPHDLTRMIQSQVR